MTTEEYLIANAPLAQNINKRLEDMYIPNNRYESANIKSSVRKKKRTKDKIAKKSRRINR